MSIDLYAILGGGRMDTRTELRAAYRRKAKTMHPDAGGDRAEFERLTQAHDVLTDAARRARYDETGEYEAAAADNTQNELYTKIGGLLDEAMNPAVEADMDLSRIDVVEQMRDILRGRRAAVTKMRAKALQVQPALLKMAKRFKRRGAGSNVLAEIMNARCARIEVLLENFRKVEDEANELLAFLAYYNFDMDDAMPAVMNGYLRIAPHLVMAN